MTLQQTHVTNSSATQSPLERLRALLDATERDIASINQSPDWAVAAIRHCDELQHLLEEIQQTRIDVRGESGRAESLQRKLVRDAPHITRLIHSVGQASLLADSPTWQAIAESADAIRRRRNRRLLIGGGVLGTLALLFLVVLPWLFPAPPRGDTEGIGRLVDEGKLDEALAHAQEERVLVPSDAEVALWLGAIQQRRGEATAAQTTWAGARQQLNNDTVFFFQRGNILQRIGELDLAEQDARQLIALPKAATEGYLLLGGVEEQRGRVPEAAEAYREAANLAGQDNNAELEVLAKTRLGFLLQSGAPAPPTPTP